MNGGSARSPFANGLNGKFPVVPFIPNLAPVVQFRSTPNFPFSRSGVRAFRVRQPAPPGRSWSFAADVPFAPFPFVAFIRAKMSASVQVVQVRVSPVVREPLFPC